MKEKQDDATQAFQFPAVEGMTLRDWFAGMALAGHSFNRDGLDEVMGKGQCFRIATDAFAIADAMMEVRK